ncbi:MAG: DNA-protecting protein DprA [Desertifilum sp. SIO1I2]|nr:DNA-protecting protein DprA [Desertifilum sp. SIO1I2]
MAAERIYWLAWSQVPGIGPVLIKRLQQQFGSLAIAWHAPANDLVQVEGLGRTSVEALAAKRQQIHPEAFFTEHLKTNPHFWTPADPEYPRLLLEIPNPPPVLYYRGTVCPSENQGFKPTVGIVGTREPTEYGKRWTRRLSRLLAQRGFTVVSGMAQGIDTEAHRGCLEAGGRTIAALGTGVDLVYPPRNRSLYDDILQQGLVVSEYPAGTQPNRIHFPQRNRIIAGWSRAILVMEAPTQSGALITAHVANDFGRDVYALPGRLDDPQSAGCLGLLSKGAQAIQNEGYLMEVLGAMPQLDVPEQLSLFATPESLPQATPDLSPELAKVFQALTLEPMGLDQIVEQLQIDTGEVLSALSQLELIDLVTGLPGLRYQRNPS